MVNSRRARAGYFYNLTFEVRTLLCRNRDLEEGGLPSACWKTSVIALPGLGCPGSAYAEAFQRLRERYHRLHRKGAVHFRLG